MRRIVVGLVVLALAACGGKGSNGSGGAGGTGGGGGSGGTGGTGGSSGKHVFVTSGTYNGDLKTISNAADGLAGADALCTTVAHGAGLTGSYKAWLSSSTVDAIDRFADVGPWYQYPKGKSPVLTFQNKAALAGTPLTDLSTDEHGETQLDVCVWTGTNSGGRHADDTCQGWTSANTFDFGSLTENQAATWTSGGSCGGATRDSCSAAYHVYCFEQ